MTPRMRPDWTLRGHVAVTVAALLAAALAWSQPDWLRSPGDAAVLPSATGALTAVAWQAGGVQLRLARDAKGQLLVYREPAGAQAQACPASAAAEAAWGRLARLRAVRTLGRLSAAQREASGLGSPTATLALCYGTATYRLTLGNAPFGRTERFAENAAGNAFLLAGATLAPLLTESDALCAPQEEATEPARR